MCKLSHRHQTTKSLVPNHHPLLITYFLVCALLGCGAYAVFGDVTKQDLMNRRGRVVRMVKLGRRDLANK